MAKLYFYYAAMNAGKSTTLLQAAHNYEECGMTPLLFCPQLDDRYDVGRITSRIGVEREAECFDDGFDFYVAVRDRLSSTTIDCVLVDEAQFLNPKQVLQLTLICDRLGVPVLCYGLRTDFRGEPFVGSQYLLAWADELVELKAICSSGSKATMNARTDPAGNQIKEGAQVDIGHHYVAMSRKQFRLDQVSPVNYTIPEDAPDSDAADSSS